MTWGRWLKDQLARLLFGEQKDLAEVNRALWRTHTRDEALEAIKNHHLLQHPAAEAERQAILAIIEHPLDRAGRARLQQLLRGSLVAQNYMLRPGTIEEVWQLEGMFDRLLEP